MKTQNEKDKDIETEKALFEVRKMNEEARKFFYESRKLDQESRKLDQEARLNAKKVRWYEFTILIAVIAATAAFTKYFLL